MEIAVVSPQFEVAIPRSVADKLGIRPGHQLQVIELDERIALVPLRPAREFRAFLGGMNGDFEREPDRG